MNVQFKKSFFNYLAYALVNLDERTVEQRLHIRVVGLAAAHIALCRKAAEESMVLLKNEGNLLPLNRKQKISLVGKLADDRNEVCGA